MKKNNSNKVKLGASDKIVRGFGYVVITIYAVACVFPFLLILGSSFTAEARVLSLRMVWQSVLVWKTLVRDFVPRLVPCTEP